MIIDGAGSGQVRVVDTDFSCASDCESVFDSANELTLEATPDSSSTFLHWDGDCDGAGDCRVVLDGYRQVIATFASTAGGGSGGSGAKGGGGGGDGDGDGDGDPPPDPTEVTVAITSSADDTMYDPYSSGMLTDGSWCSMYSPAHVSGLRFQLDLPRDVTILDAYLEVYVDSTDEDTPIADFYIEDADDAVSFTDPEGDILGRIPASPLAEWVATDIGAGWQQSPSMASLVQEWADRPGRATSGGHLMIIGRQRSDVIGFEFRQWDNAAGYYAPRLTVVYE